MEIGNNNVEGPNDVKSHVCDRKEIQALRKAPADTETVLGMKTLAPLRRFVLAACLEG